MILCASPSHPPSFAAATVYVNEETRVQCDATASGAVKAEGDAAVRAQSVRQAKKGEWRRPLALLPRAATHSGSRERAAAPLGRQALTRFLFSLPQVG